MDRFLVWLKALAMWLARRAPAEAVGWLAEPAWQFAAAELGGGSRGLAERRAAAWAEMEWKADPFTSWINGDRLRAAGFARRHAWAARRLRAALTAVSMRRS